MLAFQRVGVESKQILHNLFELYVHDMSEWFGIETRADGSFGHDTSSYWSGDCAVFLAKRGEALAGFAVVGSAEQWLGKREARDIKEFFVLRAHRHAGVADAMAQHLWNEFPAEWIVRVLATNKPAVPFWRRSVRAYTNGVYEDRSPHERGRDWVHLRFDNRRTEDGD